MGKALLYVGGLALASVAVFFAVYFAGRPSLEDEIARLRLPPAAPSDRGRGIPSLQAPVEVPPPPPPGGIEVEQTVAEGIVVTRTPLSAPAIGIVIDLEGVGNGYRGAVASFFAQPPVPAAFAVRALSGAPGDCSGTHALRALGPWAPDALLAALDGGLAVVRGPRSPARAVEAAIADLDGAEGERAVIVIASGGDGCGDDPCTGAGPGGTAARVHAVLLVSPEEAAAGNGAPRAPFETPEEPAWVAGYRCLAERTGGTVALVASPGELGRRLRLVSQGLESTIVVRAFHGHEAEVRGIAPESSEWGASLTARGATEGEVTVRLSPSLPAVFAVPAGTWDLRCQYNGVLRRAPVSVAPGERAEVRVTFATGELYVEARDSAGGEIAGDSAGFGCLWGVEIFPEEGEEAVAASCALPSRLELPAGSYRVLVRWKDHELATGGVSVEAGGVAVRSVDFSASQE